MMGVGNCEGRNGHQTNHEELGTHHWRIRQMAWGLGTLVVHRLRYLGPASGWLYSPTFVQGVIDFVVSQVLLEVAHAGLAIDNRQFEAGDGGKIFDHFRGDRLAETRVMRTAAVN